MVIASALQTAAPGHHPGPDPGVPGCCLADPLALTSDRPSRGIVSGRYTANAQGQGHEILV